MIILQGYYGGEVGSVSYNFIRKKEKKGEKKRIKGANLRNIYA